MRGAARAISTARRVPVALKIAPDLDDAQVQAIADAVRRHRIDAVIATNTSTGREGVEGLRHAQEAGGLSGAPIARVSTSVLQSLKSRLGNEVALIGAGGILSGADAAAKRDRGRPARAALHRPHLPRAAARVRMRIGVPREVKDGESRVALTPAGVAETFHMSSSSKAPGSASASPMTTM